MNVMSLIKLLGGLGLFLFGMTLMGDSLEKTAGERLEQTLAKITNNPLKGVVFGAAVTAVIQSSSATTVMVVGFVNAGIMSLTQAAGVIMGANIGTTITAQILRLDSTGSLSKSAYFQLLKPTNLAYIAVMIGMILLFSKIKKRDIGKIFIGFGILFIGMNTMETALSGLAENPQFARMFTAFKNPVIGLLIGLVLTAVIQSSSASIGILQALASTGIVSWAAAIPIILGQNIGSCITAMLASIGAKKNARRAALIHVLFNIIGTAVFMLVFYTITAFVKPAFLSGSITKSGIANFHTLFNLAATVLFLPFTKLFVLAVQKLVKGGDDEEQDMIVLDKRFYETPVVALERCHDGIAEMGKKSLENLKAASGYVLGQSIPDIQKFDKNENFLDIAEVKIGQYMVGIKQDKLSANSRGAYNEMIWSVCEFERIGDYAESIFNRGEQMKSRKSSFDAQMNAELKRLCAATEQILEDTLTAYIDCNTELAERIEPMRRAMDFLKVSAENKFIGKLNNERYNFNIGIIFMDIAHNCQKIAEHCSVLALNIIEAYEKQENFDRREYLNRIHSNPTEVYSECYNDFIGKYAEPAEA